jgi:hypothetical protein
MKLVKLVKLFLNFQIDFLLFIVDTDGTQVGQLPILSNIEDT